MIMTIGKIFKKGFKKYILVPRKTNDIFDRGDQIDTKMVYIKNIKKDPVGKMRFGDYYNYKDIEIIGNPENLYTENTIKTLFDMGLISHEYDEEHPVCHDWLLGELVQNDNESNFGALTAVYENCKELYNNEKLTALVSLASNPKALEWLFNNGAKLASVSGYGNPVEHQEISGQVRKTSKNIDYLLKHFNCSNIDELKNLVKEY